MEWPDTVGGRLEYAAAEERNTRIRFQVVPREHSVATIRGRYDLGPDSASAVVGDSFLPGLPLPMLPHYGYDIFGWVHRTILAITKPLGNAAWVFALERVLTPFMEKLGAMMTIDIEKV